VAVALVLEVVNAALEAVVDALHPDAAAPIRCAKDRAAVAVLAASTGAGAAGVLMVASVAIAW
jgi:diacylglycerol kinase